jgi:hypothetical protein
MLAALAWMPFTRSSLVYDSGFTPTSDPVDIGKWKQQGKGEAKAQAQPEGPLTGLQVCSSTQGGATRSMLGIWLTGVRASRKYPP